ncbi:SGNH/GDSL hydrolase family protein [Vibrio ostreicida]|uniref:SGNH/GDSL hydrolase family protein n=1 Tax=Vibrio ostreicida TaxID=526588 RepID=A0ABT8BVV3_9VIBR|nr:SGNH/GDSL hydrolase family protein [Vibrio ostreicida]MDN3610265.1 SGNH/GDSL hydrolase family protein [Vibrio ostreicida]NPD07719.1 SGNH/GDSL hydrolase family protein [Vibrio ostreicida]
MLLNKTKEHRSALGRVKGLALTAVLGAMMGCAGNPYVTEADRNDVITLGDSIFDLSGELQQFLEGPDMANTTFRDYTLSGAKMTGGIVARPVIEQYQDARQDDPNIKIVVMNGGGNDILLPAMLFDPNQCKTTWYRPELSDKCKSLVDDVYVETVNLLDQMNTHGTNHVVYLGYYYTTGSKVNMHQAIDFGDQRLAQACTNTSVSCEFLDTRALIQPEDVLSDNIHPTTSGSYKLAQLIWPALNAVL